MRLFYPTSLPIATNISKNFPLANYVIPAQAGIHLFFSLPLEEVFSLALEGRGQGEGEFFFYIPALKNGDWLLF